MQEQVSNEEVPDRKKKHGMNNSVGSARVEGSSLTMHLGCGIDKCDFTFRGNSKSCALYPRSLRGRALYGGSEALGI